MERPTLPQDLDAEMAVLGAMLVEETAARTALEIIDTPKAFMLPHHRKVFESVRKMIADGEPIDLILQIRRMPKDESEPAEGWTAALITLAESFADTANVAHYARIVMDMHVRRMIQATCRRAIIDAGSVIEHPEAEVVAASVISGLRELSGAIGAPELVTAQDLIRAVPDRLQDRGSGGRCPLGYPQMDDKLGGGLERPCYFILAGRPSIGKTSMALEIGREFSRRKEGVLVFSAEMPARKLADRLFVQASETPMGIWRHRKSPSEQRSGADAAVFGLEGPIHIRDNMTNVVRIVAEAEAHCARVETTLIVVDYIQLLKPGRKVESRNLEIGEISQALLALGQRTNTIILALSQLNRSIAKEATRPRLHHLRDSGTLEQDADVVAFLSQRTGSTGFPPDENGEWPKVPVLFDVAKNRDGGTPEQDMVFQRRTMSFFEDVPEYVSDHPAPSEPVRVPRPDDPRGEDDDIPF